MSYEFNAGDSLSNEFQNPFIIENKFLLMASSIYMAGGFYVLWLVRGYMQQEADGAAIAGGLAALMMLAAGMKLSIQAFTQFRFIFGRNFPIGLARELAHTEKGTSPEADRLQHQLRERAIHFPEPTGPVAGLLYSLIKPLLAAPPTIQYAAQRHFESLIGMVSVLVSLCVSYILFSGHAHEGIVSWAYLPLTGLTLLKPFLRAKENEPPKDSRFVMMRIAFLAVFAILGPVLIPRFLPAIDVPPMWIAPLCLLLGSIGASGLFFAAVVARIDSAPQTAVSCEQTTIDMNCQPSQLWTTIKRDFQANWERNIPNRPYSNVPPVAQESKGSFNGSVLEETQPTPTNIIEYSSVTDALKADHSRYLVLLAAWATAMALIAAVVGMYWAGNYMAMSRMEISRSLLTLMAFETATLLAFKIGHLLWSRMYFKSRLIWIEVEGTYQSAQLDIGNQITGYARSRSEVIRVEDATLRVWCTDIVSVAFGKESERFVMAMAPIDSFARSMAENLKRFAANQSMVVSPTSSRDIGKTEALTGMGQLMGNQSPKDIKRLVAAEEVMQDEGPGFRGDSAEQQIGRVVFYNEAKRFGFVYAQDGTERYFSGSQIMGGAARLEKDQRVMFKPAVGSGNRPQAREVTAMT